MKNQVKLLMSIALISGTLLTSSVTAFASESHNTSNYTNSISFSKFEKQICYVNYALKDDPIQTAIDWAIEIANDSKHGYSQTNRTGPDYDCSSFVLTAYKNAGFDVKIGNTKTMKDILTKVGFKDVKSTVTLSNGNGLKPGDVLLAPGDHTAMYIGDNKIVHASKDKDGKTGESKGEEILVQKYYKYSWSYVLRYDE